MVFVNSLRTGGAPPCRGYCWGIFFFLRRLMPIVDGWLFSFMVYTCQSLVDYCDLMVILSSFSFGFEPSVIFGNIVLINDGWSAIIILIISIHIILTLIIPGACNILNDVKRVMFSRDMNRVLCDSGLVNTECRGPGGSQLQSHFTSTVGKMVPPFDSSVGEHNSNKYGFCWWYIELVNGIINQLITWGAPPWENVLEIFIRALMNPELTN